MSDSGKKPALSLSPALCFLPDLVGRYERIVSEAERALLVDVERAREILRGFIGDVRMCPGEKHGELVAEARIAWRRAMSQMVELKGKYKQW